MYGRLCFFGVRIAAGRSRACLGPLSHAARRRALSQALSADSVVSSQLAGSVLCNYATYTNSL